MKIRIADNMRNKWLYLSVSVLLYMMLRTVWDLLFINIEYDALTFIINPMGYSGMTPFVVLFVVVPCAGLFTSEYRSGFVKALLLRQSRGRYIFSVIAQFALMGALVFFLAFGILFSVALVKAPVVNGGEIPDYYALSSWAPLFNSHGEYAVLLGKLLLSMVFGTLWALLCLVCEAIFLNRFVSLVVPFVIYQTWWSIFQMSPFNPVALLRADGPLIPSLLFAFGFQFMLCIVLIICSFVVLNRRCRNA
jgi:hypothetical protein